MRPFTHPVYIPIDIALAAGRLLRKQATAGDWKLFLQYDWDTAITWYTEIVKRNRLPNMTEEQVNAEVSSEVIWFAAGLVWWADK
jgi:hypothetical protein